MERNARTHRIQGSQNQKMAHEAKGKVRKTGPEPQGPSYTSHGYREAEAQTLGQKGDVK